MYTTCNYRQTRYNSLLNYVRVSSLPLKVVQEAPGCVRRHTATIGDSVQCGVQMTLREHGKPFKIGTPNWHIYTYFTFI